MKLSTEGFIVEEGLDQHYEVLKELGDCHTMLGNFDRARQCYEEAALLAKDKPGPHVGRGVVAMQTGCHDEAERAFNDAIQLDDRCAEAYGGLAMLYQQRAEYPKAFDYYLKSLDRDTDNLVALLGLFQTACQMGSFQKVIYYLKLYIERHPGDVSVLFCLATLYSHDGLLDEAADALQTILALDPSNAEAAQLLKDVEKKRAQASSEAASK
jgi:tetratricopeptide (TPR) repeat protein